MAEENFLMTPGSAMMEGLLTPAKSSSCDEGSSARKELRFDESAQQQLPVLLRAPHFLGNNLMDAKQEQDEHEDENEGTGKMLLSEQEVAERLLWGLLGIGRLPSSNEASASHASVVARVKPVCFAYADCVRAVHAWCFGQSCCLAKEGFAWALDAVLQREYRPKVLLLEQQLLQLNKAAGGQLPKIVQASMILHQVVAPLQLICSQLEQARSSAEVMQLLHEKWTVSIEPARATISYLLFGAAQPYFERISCWINGDELRDPFDELFVSSVKGSDSVVLRTGARYLPRFLKREIAVLLLECGQVGKEGDCYFFFFFFFLTICLFVSACPHVAQDDQGQCAGSSVGRTFSAYCS